MLQLSFSNVYSQYIQSETFQCPSQQIWGDQINENMRMSLTQVRTVGLDQVSYCNMKCIKHYKFWQKMYIKIRTLVDESSVKLADESSVHLGRLKFSGRQKFCTPGRRKFSTSSRRKFSISGRRKFINPTIIHSIGRIKDCSCTDKRKAGHNEPTKSFYLG